jgi:hypothetical protein
MEINDEETAAGLPLAGSSGSATRAGTRTRTKPVSKYSSTSCLIVHSCLRKMLPISEGTNYSRGLSEPGVEARLAESCVIARNQRFPFYTEFGPALHLAQWLP